MHAPFCSSLHHDPYSGIARSAGEPEEEIAELSVHIDAATWRRLRAIREFDNLEAWGDGFLSCAHRMSWRTGMDLRCPDDISTIFT